MGKRELYFSLDVEADGPAPIVHSMLSIGAVALDIYDEKGVFRDQPVTLGSYTANLKVLPEATEDPDTMEWWKTQPEAWKKATENPRDPKEVMVEFAAWVTGLCGDKFHPVMTAYPAGFDFSFIYVYLVKFLGKSVFGFSCYDMKTGGAEICNLPFRASAKRNYPKTWTQFENKHEHVALSDAIEQGQMYHEMMRSRKALHDELKFLRLFHKKALELDTGR